MSETKRQLQMTKALILLSVLVLLTGIVGCNQSFGSGGSPSKSAVFNGKGPGTQIVDLPEGEYFVEIKVSGNKECIDSALGPICEDRLFAVSVDGQQLVDRSTQAWAGVVALEVGKFGHIPARFPLVVNSAPSGSWELKFTPKSIPTPTPIQDNSIEGIL